MYIIKCVLCVVYVVIIENCIDSNTPNGVFESIELFIILHLYYFNIESNTFMLTSSIITLK